VDVQSNISVAGGYDQRGGERGLENTPGQRPQAAEEQLQMGGGLTRAIAKITQRQTDATLDRELDWQARVGGDATKVAAFKEQVLNQQGFRAFAFMKGTSPVIHMAHSIGSFFGLSGLATDVQGKQIAFVGDRVQGRQPIPFVLPPQNAWTWARVRYLADMERYVEHYSDDANKDKLWITGAGDNDLTERQLPRLLALPTVVAEFVAKQGGTCLPYNVSNFITSYIEAGTAQVSVEKWDLLLQWCLAASQVGTDGSSLLKLGAPEPALCQDEEFLEWCGHKLATTLGREPESHQANRGGPQDNIHLVQRITENMGRSFVAGVQALAPTIVGATRQGGILDRDTGGEGMGGRMYS